MAISIDGTNLLSLNFLSLSPNRPISKEEEGERYVACFNNQRPIKDHSVN